MADRTNDTFDGRIQRFFDAMDGSGFFEPGHTYIRQEPFKAPEITQVFRCVAIAENPRNGEPRAFGFGNYADLKAAAWFSTACTPGDWAAGWVLYEQGDD